MLDYKLLEAFALVVREQGFERAARALHITQSAVSQRVRLLEERAGSVLLVRSNPPQPTTAGRAMLAHHAKVHQLEDDLLATLPGAAPSGRPVLRVGVNADSLATWFLDVMSPFLAEEDALLDLCVDDQDQTHKFLAAGEVVGCVSAMATPAQGCRAVRLGRMDYRLLGTPEYAAYWFPEGFTLEAAAKAPFIIFNRKDDLHNKIMSRVLGETPGRLNAHYMPSAEQFPVFVASGLGCGMLPDQQSLEWVLDGRLVDLCGVSEPVDLYWHCWDLKSDLLDRLTRTLVNGAAEHLEQPDD